MTDQLSYQIGTRNFALCTLPSFCPLSRVERHGRRQKVQYLKIMNCRMTVRLRLWNLVWLTHLLPAQ